ncbi:EscU/YscU/HrcU family type III secretion system export apparatus switch protein [Janthinobacterium fluminis]|uniref:EscU/YscU/HrcU family type III secretion system export apparatus switch protein n=1 Tax=Janthinobacterium fluminis TaxID=2987524 RepID=A0ABT5K2U3_9BURK|nr:EscU/YscU/HrcU family type III secretion system export apparatus switch protein [Janthinobacterium fluminis]MDC8759303.1 EscU/YscU/HrcU family type III secretion system export apparatus switch protein [Janthinobacterium fluminis]
MPNDNQPRALQTAVALAYQSGAAAPTVVAKGSGLIAGQIIERAREHGVFVHESKELVALLMDIDLDRQIPPALYRAIAELLAWLYHIESAQKSGATLPPPPDTASSLLTET